MKSRLTVWLAGFALAACGGGGSATSDGTSGTSGAGPTGGGTIGGAGSAATSSGAGGASGGTGGTVSGGAGGSGGTPAGAAPRGAVSLSVEAPGSCMLPVQSEDFPPLVSGHPVSKTNRAGLASNGDSTADGLPIRVVCKWLKSASSLQFDALIEIGTGTKSRFVDMGAKGLAPGQSGLGDVGLETPDFMGSYAARVQGCTYTVLELDDATRSIWGELSCPTFENSDTNDTCALGTSFFAFENCTPL